MTNLAQQSILLYRSQSRADAALKVAAKRGEAFGKKFTTPNNLIRDFAHHIYPNAKVISDIERAVFVISVVDSIEDDELQDYFFTPGSISFLCNFVKTSTGMLNVDALEPDNFSNLELEAINIAKKYASTIGAFGYVELSQCACEMADKINARFNIELREEINLAPSQLYFLNHISKNQLEVVANHDIDFYKKCLKNKDLAICKLSGKEAFYSALVKTLKDNADVNDVLLLANEPKSEFLKVARLLSEENFEVNIETQAKVKIKDTYIGQALISAYDIICDAADVEMISDLLKNPLLGISFYDANTYDAYLRANELKIEDAISKTVEFIKNKSNSFKLIYDVMDLPIAQARDSLFALTNELEEKIKLDRNTKKTEIDAIKGVSAILELLFKIGAVEEFSPEFFEMISFPSAYSCKLGKSDKSLLILDTSFAKQIAPAAYDLVICKDVSTDAFSASTKTDALNSLLAKLGLEQSQTQLDIARVNFASVLGVSNKKIALMLPGRDLNDASELYPSFALQEMAFELCGSTDYTKIKEKMSILDSFAIEKFGEDLISKNVGLNSSVDKNIKKREVYPLNFSLKDKKLLISYLDNNCAGAGVLVMTPSAIETYVQCPYKWFYNYVICARELDKEFSPADAGSIAHLAFKKFYDSLYNKGVYRIDAADDVVNYQGEFRDSFQAAAKELFDIDVFNFGSYDLYPDDVTINLKLNKLANTCTNSLLAQIFIPKDYIVLESEFEITRDDNIVYAGALISGRVDRIDVNRNRESFLVIDYKGNIEDHGAGFSLVDMQNVANGEDFIMPHKTQALIYASAIEKKINLKCDGALYLTYNDVKPKKLPATGTISIDVADGFRDIVNVDKFACQIDMSEYLNLVEGEIAKRIDNLKNGDIEPRPLAPSVCNYCGVIDCPLRGARI